MSHQTLLQTGKLASQCFSSNVVTGTSCGEYVTKGFYNETATTSSAQNATLLTVDALYVQLAKGDVKKTEEIKLGVMFDYDTDGNILGLEVLNVSKREELPAKEAA